MRARRLLAVLAPAVWLLATGTRFVSFARADDELRPLTYRGGARVVDLGVGLWAWPLPMDYDGDGDPDLVISCPDKPYNGTYFFENPGAPAGELPVFRPPRRIGPGHFNVRASYPGGDVRVLLPGRELVEFREKGFAAPREIYPRVRVHPGDGKIRANQWHHVDHDGDGALDLVVGVGDWEEYGWDDAFDEEGRWTRGPLHGWVYLLRNESTSASPRYADPVRLRAGEEAIDVFGMPSPSFADFDGDGDHDLVVGEEDGRVAFVEHSGSVRDGLPVFASPRFFRQEADLVKFGALVTPYAFDWDGDGDEDLLCGNTAGYIGLFENLDGGAPPRLAAPVYLRAGGEVIRVQAGENGSIQGPCEAKWGYTTLTVADWDGDDLPDLIVNSIWGTVRWYRNAGQRSAPRLEAARDVEVAWEGEPLRPAWNWWKPQPGTLATQWRTTPCAVDWNDDGLTDLVMLDHEGYLAFYERQRVAGRLTLRPPRRIFVDESGAPLRLNERRAGGSGRRKLAVADWDGDGDLDVLVNSENADLLEGEARDDGTYLLRARGALDARKLAGHTTSPAVVDWNGDGVLDLLVGGEDGHIYYRERER